MPTVAALDADELMHLAVAASDRDEADRAIGLLKRAVEVSPAHAQAHYLLGAEHAQIGMFERAIEDMRRAVELEPSLHAARFQLGLLYLTSRRLDAAVDTWRALDALGADNFYVLFKTGLEHLARDEFDACLRALRAGLKANTVNQPLNVDMQRVIAQVEDLIARNGAGPTPPAAAAESGHLFIHAYTGSRHQ
jgi:tetratricopeptide (TPR) repeat protein